MRVIHVSVRVATVRGALSHGDHGSLVKVLHSFIHSFISVVLLVVVVFSVVVLVVMDVVGC